MIMRRGILAFIIIHYTVSYEKSTNRFCQLPCASVHVACLREPCSKGIACGNNFKALPLYLSEIELVLHQLNQYRNKVAKGKGLIFTTGAADMRVLSWDYDLEYVAQCVANSCYTYSYDNFCKSTEEFPFVGQLSFLSKSNEFINEDSKTVLRKVINRWFAKRHLFSDTMIDQYYEVKGSSARSFIQIIWAESYKVGCGRSYSKDVGYVLVCNFAPSKIDIFQFQVFAKGPPCSKCTKGLKCNTKYDGLCGEQENYTKPAFIFDDYEEIDRNLSSLINSSSWMTSCSDVLISQLMITVILLKLIKIE